MFLCITQGKNSEQTGKVHWDALWMWALSSIVFNNLMVTESTVTCKTGTFPLHRPWYILKSSPIFFRCNRELWCNALYNRPTQHSTVSVRVKGNNRGFYSFDKNLQSVALNFQPSFKSFAASNKFPVSNSIHHLLYGDQFPLPCWRRTFPQHHPATTIFIMWMVCLRLSATVPLTHNILHIGQKVSVWFHLTWNILCHHYLAR